MQSCANNDVINKKNTDSMWTRPSRGGNGYLFMDFRDMMSSLCQQGDPCLVSLKFELLINLLAFKSSRSPVVNCNNSDSCILCDKHLPPNSFGIQDATCWANHNEITPDIT